MYCTVLLYCIVHYYYLQVISTVAAACVMDRLGRRILLCLSALFMMISISLLGVCIYYYNIDCLSVFLCFVAIINVHTVPWEVKRGQK